MFREPLPIDPEVPGVPPIKLNEFFSADDPVREASIFFLETGSNDAWAGRHMCAFEAAAKHNPNRTVYVLTRSTSLKATKTLLQLGIYPNIRFMHLTPHLILQGTPMELWLKTSAWLDASHFTQLRHLSDALRLAVVYKYGGSYIDSDQILLHSLDGIANATVFTQNRDNPVDVVNSALINFPPKNSFLKLCMDTALREYQPSVWGSIGPDLMQKIVSEEPDLEINIWTDLSTGFSPIYQPAWHDLLNLKEIVIHGLRESPKAYFDPDRTEYVMEKISKSKAVHLFNALTNGYTLDKNCITGLGLIAASHCPTVWSSSTSF